jgi:hypothetical protein
LAPAVKLGEKGEAEADPKAAKAKQCRFDEQGQARNHGLAFRLQ